MQGTGAAQGAVAEVAAALKEQQGVRTGILSVQGPAAGGAGPVAGGWRREQ